MPKHTEGYVNETLIDFWNFKRILIPMLPSTEDLKSGIKTFGIAFAILLGIVLFVPSLGIKALAQVGLAVTGWQFFFLGSTIISLSLGGTARRHFQIAVIVIFPLLLSLYFLKDVTSFTLLGVTGAMVTPWVLIPLGLIAYFSWSSVDFMDKEHPFRGFVIACTIIFVVSYLGYHGYASEEDYSGEATTVYLDKEKAKLAAERGLYWGQFLTYVVVSYVAMLLKIMRNRPSSVSEV